MVDDDDSERMRRDALAMLEHELRKPLNGLSLQLELMRRIADRRGEPHTVEGVLKAQDCMVHYLDLLAQLLPLAVQPRALAARARAHLGEMHDPARLPGA